MKTALQRFIEMTGDKLDCCLMQKVQEILEIEKACVAHAYESGLIAAQKDLKIGANDYFKRFYADPNENTDASIDMLVGSDSGRVKKPRRKRISRQAD